MSSILSKPLLTLFLDLLQTAEMEAETETDVKMKESETHHCKGVSLRGVAIEFV